MARCKQNLLYLAELRRHSFLLDFGFEGFVKFCSQEIEWFDGSGNWRAIIFEGPKVTKC
jgi:hypothetical protein